MYFLSSSNVVGKLVTQLTGLLDLDSLYICVTNISVIMEDDFRSIYDV